MVIGILIALQINNWNERRKDRADEKIALEEFSEDFLQDHKEYENVKVKLISILKSMVILLEQSALSEPNLSVQELNDHFKKIQDMPTYTGTDRAYLNLTGSGRFGILRNRNLKGIIARYYSAGKLFTTVQNTHEMELVETFQPYIIDYMEYQAVLSTSYEDVPLPPKGEDETMILSVLNDRKFRNVVTQKWVITNDLLHEHNQYEKMRAEVISLLNSELMKN